MHTIIADTDTESANQGKGAVMHIVFVIYYKY